jgi:hypothetical protein
VPRATPSTATVTTAKTHRRRRADDRTAPTHDARRSRYPRPSA